MLAKKPSRGAEKASGRRRGGGTYLQLPLHLVQLPQNLRQLPLLLHFVGGGVDRAPAARCKQAQHQRLHILRVGAGRGQKVLFRRLAGNAERGSSYLFIGIPEGTGKPLAESWKAAETGACD